MLTEKDYCDYETCVALKELGFREKCHAYYDSEDNVGLLYNTYWTCGAPCQYFDVLESHNTDTEHEIDAPTLYEAQKWMREEKDIHIEVYACAGGYIYELCKAYKPQSFSGGTTIYTPNDVDNPKLNDAGRYDDFEMCLSEGIKGAVKILKEK